MGKQGPCCHCGVTSTPLWRNGPLDKPVLCNACGSRWRTKGTLINYAPLHARLEADEFEGHRVAKVKSISLKNKDVKFLKRKQNHNNAVVGGIVAEYSQGFLKPFDDDTSNRSSSGSAISNCDSCMQLGGVDAIDLTGPSQSVVWDTVVPSRKRTCVSRSNQSSIEKLTKDLCTIFHEQQSRFSESSEGDLLYESDKPMVSVEIGHGSVLMRHPSSNTREDESEASSLSVDNKMNLTNEAYSSTWFPVHGVEEGVNNSNKGCEKLRNSIAFEAEKDQTQRNKAKDGQLEVLGNQNSPSCSMDLKDVLNFEEFFGLVAHDEQHHLLKYLTFVDTSPQPDRLKSMFDSPQFKENLVSLQKLLADGVFGHSSSDVNRGGCGTLKNLALFNTAKSKWFEQYNFLQDEKSKCSTGRSAVADADEAFVSSHVVNTKRSRNARNQSFHGAKTAIQSPKRVLMEETHEHSKELLHNDGTFSPKSPSTLPSDNTSHLLDSLGYLAEDTSDQELLLDVPSRGSFPQAELLLPTSSSVTQGSPSSGSILQNLSHT